MSERIFVDPFMKSKHLSRIPRNIYVVTRDDRYHCGRGCGYSQRSWQPIALGSFGLSYVDTVVVVSAAAVKSPVVRRRFVIQPALPRNEISPPTSSHLGFLGRDIFSE